MKKESLTREIDWFCHHAVSERLLSREECVAIMDAIEENGLKADLTLFVDVIKDNAMCKNEKRIDEIAAMSVDEARVFGNPARSIFSNKGEPAVHAVGPTRPAGTFSQPQPQPFPPEPTSAKPPPPAPPPSPSTSPTTIFGSSTGPAWLTGWPRLEDAAGMAKEDAQELLNSFLHKAREMECSDIHLSAGARPYVRRFKQVFLIPDQGELSADAAERLNFSPLNETMLEHFEKHHDLDYGYSIHSNDRYRTNLMHQRLGVSGAYRVIDTTIRTIRDLGFKLPEVIEKLTTYGQGLILVTGPAGSGKSSTLTALVDHINKNRHDHIITVEDPIEVVHKPLGCNITQRELNKHTKSFGNALRAALREDPDVIVIGEMRDLETIEMAIHSSETGHLVIGTLHTSSAADTMNRILDVFPHGQQAQIRAMVAESLKGVICQQLLPNKNGDGVVLAAEILLGTLAVSNLIREGKTYQLDSTIQTSKNIGMVTMEQSHFDLYMSGRRSYEQTVPFVRNKDLLRQMQQNEAAGLGGVATGQMRPVQPEPPRRRRWF